MMRVDNLIALHLGRLAARDIAVVKAILDGWGYPPKGDIYNLIRAFMAERIRREGEDDADRDIVHRPR